MELGTAQTFTETEEDVRRKRLAGISSGSSSGSGGPHDDGGGDGGNGPEPPITDYPGSATADKSRYVAYFLMMAVGMTFAGLLGAYLMISTNRDVEWKPFDLPYQTWISTAIIIASSLAYARAKRGVDEGAIFAARKWLVITTVLGAVFISSQLVLWVELVRQGYYLSGNPYAGFFYILTAAHAIHVAGGIVALSAILLSSWYKERSADEAVRRRQLARSVGWYWHFMGGLWILLVLILGFWK